MIKYKGYRVKRSPIRIIYQWYAKKVIKGQVRTAHGDTYKELKMCIDFREKSAGWYGKLK